MNYLAAQKFARRAYCPEDERSEVVVRMAPEREYVVVCPRNADHPLNMAKSQFQEYLSRWRQGEQLFSLEGLVFRNTLRVRMRKDPERWDYEEGPHGNIIRLFLQIGKDLRISKQVCVFLPDQSPY